MMYLWKVTVIMPLLLLVNCRSALAAKFIGQNWHDSLTIGALMNTRGLMN
jgi:hypothetical protein